MDFFWARYRTFKNRLNLRRRGFVNSIGVLLVFLLVSCFLIFAIATLGIQRDQKKWLPINATPQVSADYQVYEEEAPQRARIDLEILEAVQEDRAIAVVASPVITVTSPETPTPTPSPTPTLELTRLLVDIGGPYNGDEGSFIVFEATSPNPGPLNYLWDLDNDGLYDDDEGASILAQFLDEGLYPISIEASDETGQVVTDTTIVSIANVPPIVTLGPDQEVNEAEEFTLTAEVTDPGEKDILLLEWDFGDELENTFASTSTTYTYADNGDYLVRLRVRDNDGGVTEDTLLMQVNNLPPEVDAGLDQIAIEGRQVVVNGVATDPAGDADPLVYAWDFDYDEDDFFDIDALGQEASFTYKDGPKTFLVALRVQDDDGGEAIDTLKVSVTNANPADLRITLSGDQSETQQVTAQVSATDIGSDTLSFSFDWNNDGNFEAANQLAPTDSHIYPDNGDYTLFVLVDDGDGGQVFDTRVITIANLPPTAVADVIPSVTNEGSSVSFNGNDSSDPAGAFDPLLYTWNLGDGGSASGPEVNGYTYGDQGIYTATLTVDDQDQGTNTTIIPVTINNVNPLAFAGDDLTIDEGQSHTFNGSATDPGPEDNVFTFAWDLSYDGATFTPQVNGPSATRAYLDGPATFNVALRARDDDYPASPGQIGEAIDTLQVTVVNLAPTNVEANGPYSGLELLPVTLAANQATDVASDTLTYQWDIDNDGQYADDNLTGRTVTYTWLAAGNYTIGLRVSDEDGGQAFDTADVIIGNAPPVAIISTTLTVNEDALPITLDGSQSFDPTGQTITHTWDLDNDGAFDDAIGPFTTLSPPDDGVYTVTLRVEDSDGAATTDLALITVLDVPPTPVIVVAGIFDEGKSISFDGSTSFDPVDTIVRWDWVFGDGNTASGPLVNNIFADDGLYTVRLTVEDDDGITAFIDQPITIQNLPPTAVFTASITSIFENQTILFDAGGSSDPGNDPLTYRWTFSDDNTVVNTTAPTITHRYLDDPPGAQSFYTVTLRVRDDEPLFSGNVTMAITVANQAPTGVAFVGLPYSTVVSAPITLTVTASDVPSDTINYDWDLGDGTLIASGPPSISHTYFISTTYTITVTARDEDGGAAAPITTTVQVNNMAPIIGFGGIYLLWQRYRSARQRRKRRKHSP